MSREGCCYAGLKRSSARQEVEDEHNDGEYQEDVYPSAQRVTADESYDPEDEKDNGDCPKHGGSPRRVPALVFPVRNDVVQSSSPACGKVPGTLGRLPASIKYEAAVCAKARYLIEGCDSG
jgi:hypothetical protein